MGSGAERGEETGGAAFEGWFDRITRCSGQRRFIKAPRYSFNQEKEER